MCICIDLHVKQEIINCGINILWLEKWIAVMADEKEGTQAAEGTPEKRGRGRPRKPQPTEVSMQYNRWQLACIGDLYIVRTVYCMYTHITSMLNTHLRSSGHVEQAN